MMTWQSEPEPPVPPIACDAAGHNPAERMVFLLIYTHHLQYLATRSFLPRTTLRPHPAMYHVCTPVLEAALKVK